MSFNSIISTYHLSRENERPLCLSYVCLDSKISPASACAGECQCSESVVRRITSSVHISNNSNMPNFLTKRPYDDGDMETHQGWREPKMQKVEEVGSSSLKKIIWYRSRSTMKKNLM